MNVTAIAPQMTVEWKFSFKQSGEQVCHALSRLLSHSQRPLAAAATAYKENVLVAARKLAKTFSPSSSSGWQCEEGGAKGGGSGKCHLEL